MKIDTLLASLLIMVVVSATAQKMPSKPYTSPYIGQWEKISAASEDKRAADAQAMLAAIFSQSIIDGKLFESLRAYERLSDIKTEIDYQSRYGSIDTLILNAKLYPHAPNRALYELLLARMMTGTNPRGNQLSTNSDALSFEKWSYEMRYKAVQASIEKIISMGDTLKKEGVGIYKEFIDGGIDHKTPSNNLYVALLRASLKIVNTLYDSDSLQTYLYHTILAQTIDDTPLYISTYTDYIKHLNTQYDDPAASCDSLSRLIARYPNEPAIVKAIAANVYFKNPNLWQSEEPKVFLSLDSLCNATTKRLPNSPYIGQIKALSDQLHTKSFSANFPQQIYPRKGAQIDITYQNMTNLTISVWRLDGQSNISSLNIAQDSLPKIVENKRAIWSQSPQLKKQLYLFQTQKIPLTIEREGVYVLGAQSTDSVKMSYNLLYVSSVGTIYRNIKNTTGIYAADFESGKPFNSVKISLCTETVNTKTNTITYRPSQTKKVAINGFTPITMSESSYPKQGQDTKRYAVNYGKDIFSPTTAITQWYQQTVLQRKSCYIITDRSRYMPGDTVRYKGVSYTNDDKGVHIDSLSSVVVTLHSPTNTTIESDTLTTDSWGSFDGYYVANQRAMNGHYRISAAGGTAYINIESYKTPTFAIVLNNPTRGYALGDTMRLSGRLEAFAGYPLNSIKLEYQVSEYSYMRNRAKINKSIKSYKVTCSPSGDFEISVPTAPSDARYRNYQVVLTATDLKGESQRATKSFMLGKFRYNLNLEPANSTVNRDKPMDFTAVAMTNWDDIDSLRGRYTITDSRGSSIKGSFLTGAKYELDLKKLSSGECKIAMTLDGEDKCDNRVDKFILFSAQDKTLPVDTLIFFAPTNIEATATEPITFTLGTNQSELYTQLSLTYGDSLIHTQGHIFSGGMNNFALPYSDQYPDNTLLSINFIRAGKPYNITQEVSRKQPQQQLTLRLITERKAAPGAEQSIGIEVKNGEQQSVEADVTISVFDKASQKYRKNIFRKIYSSPLSAGYIAMYNGDCFSSQQIYSIINYNYLYSEHSEDNLFVSPRSAVAYGVARSKTLPSSVTNAQMGDSGDMVGGVKEADDANISYFVRRNFRQTAAFFPNIITDTMGLAKVSYTMPDALTTYRIEAMAYTKKLDSAVASGEIVVSKDVMIIPNTPLFIRQGDEITIKATVVNSTDKQLNALASLSLSNPEKPQESIYFKDSNSKSITLAPMSSQVVEWHISQVPNVAVLAIKTSIETDTQRDSEERMVAILSPYEPIVSGKTYIISNDSVSINLRKFLKDGAKDEMMVVSSKTTPILLLNSLPFSKQVKSQNAIDMIDSWYLSSIGHNMVRRYKSYISSLAKNLKPDHNPLKEYSELTDILVEQTPWVLESQQPEERLRAMNDYLDNKATISRNRDMYREIASLQGADGGISWFKGMPSSTALTAMLLDRYAWLIEAKYYTRCSDKLFLKSMAYLDRAITEQFKQDSIAQLGDKSRDLALSTDVLNNLYIRSRFNDSIPRTHRDSVAFEHLLLRAHKSWRKGSIMDMALTALAMQNRGRDITPILNSLSQYAVKGEHGAVHYPNAVKHRALISSEIRAHALLMKLLTANQTTASLGEGVARWLMLQRHNQHWSNNSATADAVYGLWSQYFTYDKAKNPAKIGSNYPKVDGKTMLPYGDVVDTQILRTTSQPATLFVANRDNMPRFVDVIYRYSAPIKSIEPRAEGISVTRKLFIERVVGDKKVLEPIDEKSPLNIGDIVVVRNILDADNDYSFVVLESKRSGATLPVNDHSGYSANSYREVKASTTNNFFYTLPRGVTTIDEQLFVTYAGTFSDGIAKVVSLQNPTTGGNTASGIIEVK